MCLEDTRYGSAEGEKSKGDGIGGDREAGGSCDGEMWRGLVGVVIGQAVNVGLLERLLGTYIN